MRFPLNVCLVDRDPSYMGALWTRIHPYHHNLHRGVSFTTYHPPWNHCGDTSHNQRVQLLSGKEANGTLALYRPEIPCSRAAPWCNPALYTVQTTSLLSHKCADLNPKSLGLLKKGLISNPRGFGAGERTCPGFFLNPEKPW